MAKAKKATAVAVADDGDDLFAAATQKKKAQPKKPAGTTFALPKDLDGEGGLTPECAALHAAVTEAIEGKKAEDDGKNRGNLAKGRLKPFVESQYVSRIATAGCLPNTPIELVNHLGESLTYVIQDKSGSKGLSTEQLQMLGEMLGEDKVSEITVEFRSYGFAPEVMQEIAGEAPVGLKADEVADLPRVHNVVAKRLTEALKAAVKAGEITPEQKNALLTCETKTLLRKGEFERIAEHAGADAARIQGTLEALDGVITRYFKT